MESLGLEPKYPIDTTLSEVPYMPFDRLERMLPSVPQFLAILSFGVVLLAGVIFRML